MKDEQYAFVEDVRNRKATARSARSRRTHNGKGGSVKLPSDNMTKREIEAMSGEVKYYRLNKPMTWAEFKAMPDDLKTIYIKALRDKYHVTDAKIAEMLGTHFKNFSHMVTKLKLSHGQKGRNLVFDADAWYKWVNGVSTANVPEESGPEVCTPTIGEEHNEAVPEIVVAEQPVKPVTAVPDNGSMLFECPANLALNMMAQVLGDAMVHISITWDVIHKDGGES